jgi:hypothetical protein
VRLGGRVVGAGPKWVPWWRPASLAFNSYAWLLNQYYVTTFEGFDAPWSHLGRLLPDLAVEELFFGAGFIAVGTRRVASSRPLSRPVRQRPGTSVAVGRRQREPNGAAGEPNKWSFDALNCDQRAGHQRRRLTTARDDARLHEEYASRQLAPGSCRPRLTAKGGAQMFGHGAKGRRVARRHHANMETCAIAQLRNDS